MQNPHYIRVVLVEPSHPGNIGAVARAMANFGLHRLYLVNPVDFPSPAADARAAGAESILRTATVVHSLEQALEACVFVLGSTARPRRIEWPVRAPAPAVGELLQYGDQPVAVVFGRERSGLTNAELEYCQRLVRIPTVESFSSLNLSAAVTVVLYELKKQLLQAAEPDLPDTIVKPREAPATAAEIRHLYGHLYRLLRQIEFVDHRSVKLHRKLARLFSRTRLYAQEVRLLRGVLSALQKKLNLR